MMMEKRTSSGLIALIFGVVLCVGLLVFADWIFGFFKRPHIYKTGSSENYLYVDETGSWRPTPDAEHQYWNIATLRDDLIYHVTFTIDEHSRRITPITNPELRDKHLLFFGCSFIYGVGVEENETIPYYVAEQATEFMPYNYAFQGHNPAQMLAKLQTGKVPAEVAEENGHLIFTFIDDHVPRAIGSMRLVADWGATAPYYQWVRSEDLLIRKGDFDTGRPWLTNFYKSLSKSNILKFFKVEFPLQMGDKHFEHTAKIISESKYLYQQQFPNGHFSVVLYPQGRYNDGMEKALARMNIDVIRDDALINPKKRKFILAKEDRHPNPYANQLLADKLVNELGLTATV